MKRFKCHVELESDYIIEIDDNELGQEFLDAYKKHFDHNTETWEEHADYIAVRKALGDEFIEGYGTPTVNGKDPRWFPDKELNCPINIIVESENEPWCDIEEIV